ncbi:RnfABCDGE type electron transport complex subunit B [Sporohalobacter salinus]|uniref:RnfABCDGE type electron transport complex subunit B n=1 Tax=Sporohalobacter salinus TaxID=1494606 RepID=UPI00195F8672|nr:RnfABCDGE type electron transport complex subunit B [Sporohalobacter salinus]MBM7623074.1 RnfABCDGE-type electron transport complex B subunit [Sporohalobacter salinus]
MDLSLFKVSIPSMGIMGAVFAGGLAIASSKLAVEVDPRIEEIEEALPGANCGACGEPGCSSFAEAVVNGNAEINGCPVGGSEVADEIAEIMGVESGDSVRKIARLLCKGGKEETFNRSEYRGIESCKAANIAGSGNKSCVYGCLGFGDCEEVCSFDAIKMNENGLPEVNDDKCTGCRNCVEECPKDLFILVEEDQEVFIHCSSQSEGKDVKEVCKTGCIGCGICAQKCPVDAITVEDNLADIDYEECINCGACVEACPMGTIDTIETEAEETDEEFEAKDQGAATDNTEKEENEANEVEDDCSIYITDACVGCGVCVDECPVDAISGENGEVHNIDSEVCIECENCVGACPTEAIETE